MFIATLIMLPFALFGQPVLSQLGVSLAALQTAGGIILFMIALEMTLARRPGPVPLFGQGKRGGRGQGRGSRRNRRIPVCYAFDRGTRRDDERIVLAAGTKGDLKLLGAVIVAILAVMGVTLMLLLSRRRFTN